MQPGKLTAISTVADAVSALEYLHRRSLLCDTCGCKSVTRTNQFQRRCDDCTNVHTIYSKAPKLNRLEAEIMRLVQEWFSAPEGSE